MAQSISDVPPPGSVLASRVEAWRRLEYGGEIPEDVPPVLRKALEDDLIKRERRLWKLPTELVTRELLIPGIAAEYGAEAAGDLARHPRLARAIAATVQENEKLAATAPEKAREPETDTPMAVAAIVLDEFFRVGDMHPQASLNRACELTGRNLGGPGAPIDRNTIRRIVARSVSKFSSCPEPALAMLALKTMSELFGWGPARKAG